MHAKQSNLSLIVFSIIFFLIVTAGTGCMIEFVRHNVQKTTHRIAIIIGIILLCLYIWAELTVGIFTNLGS
jgi:hypothetical protein